MREDAIKQCSRDDLKLIIAALSAYQHNSRYRALYERLLALRDSRGLIDDNGPRKVPGQI